MVLDVQSSKPSICGNKVTSKYDIDNSNNNKSNSKQNNIPSNDMTNVRVYYQNVRGLGSKHKKFFCTSSTYDYDIVILTETWLKKTHLNAEYFDKSFDVFRKDRMYRRGGGVLIAINNTLFTSDEIYIPATDELEYVCIKSIAKQQNVFIYCAYIP